MRRWSGEPPGWFRVYRTPRGGTGCPPASDTRARCGGSSSRPARSATTRRRRRPMSPCSGAGTALPWHAACFSPPRPSRPPLSPAPIRMPTLPSRSNTWMRRWATPALASVTLLATACPRPAPLTPGAEPELRVGLFAGVSQVVVGGGGELFVTDDGTGAPLGAVPAGSAWPVGADSAAGGRGGGGGGGAHTRAGGGGGPPPGAPPPNAPDNHPSW